MNHLARRLAVLLGLGAISLVAIAGPASAHPEADAGAAANGRTKITFTAEAECADGAQPTNSLRVQLPQGASDVQPENQAGWSSQVTATEVKWSAPSPTIDQTTFVVEMVLAQPADTTVYLPTIQGCPNGEEIAWIEIPTSGGTEPAHPAPKIVVPANATTPSSAAVAPTTAASGPTTTARMSIEQTPITKEGSTTNNAGLVVFIVVCVVIVGGAVVLYLRHRNTGNTTPTAPAPTEEVSSGPGSGSGPDTPEQ
jgi:uncharacterized protein YcnI